MINQVSVFVENKPGRLLEVLRALSEKNIDIIALSLADTNDFGVVRIIVKDCEKTKETLKDDGVIVQVNKVTAVVTADKPGALVNALTVLRDDGISVEYMYAFAKKIDNCSIIAIRTDNRERAEETLAKNSVRVLTPEELQAL